MVVSPASVSCIPGRSGTKCEVCGVNYVKTWEGPGSYQLGAQDYLHEKRDGNKHSNPGFEPCDDISLSACSIGWRRCPPRGHARGHFGGVKDRIDNGDHGGSDSSHRRIGRRFVEGESETLFGSCPAIKSDPPRVHRALIQVNRGV